MPTAYTLYIVVIVQVLCTCGTVLYKNKFSTVANTEAFCTLMDIIRLLNLMFLSSLQ